jgi:cyclopropane fatty-acyl-phospholipid synthase-like methyltransferase
LTPFAFWFFTLVFVLALVIVWLGWSQFIGAGWSPTPRDVVERMLEFAKPTDSDILYDLGSGDGRIVIMAAKKYGAKAVGVEVDPLRVWLSRLLVRVNGVEDKVRIVKMNIFDVDLSPATIVSMFLTQKTNQRLKPRLLELKTGTRVVTHTWTFSDWSPKQEDLRLKAYLFVVRQ